jgi:hypothetical protein
LLGQLVQVALDREQVAADIVVGDAFVLRGGCLVFAVEFAPRLREQKIVPEALVVLRAIGPALDAFDRAWAARIGAATALRCTAAIIGGSISVKVRLPTTGRFQPGSRSTCGSAASLPKPRRGRSRSRSMAPT